MNIFWDIDAFLHGEICSRQVSNKNLLGTQPQQSLFWLPIMSGSAKHADTKEFLDLILKPI